MFERAKPLGRAYNPKLLAGVFFVSGIIHCIDAFTPTPIRWIHGSFGALMVVGSLMIVFRKSSTSGDESS